MKICFLTNDLNKASGWGRYANDIIEGVVALGHEVIVLTEQQDKGTTLNILKRGYGLIPSAWRVRKIILQCDLIHALDGYPYGLIAALATYGTKIPFIITAVGTYAVAPLFNRRSASLMRWAYGRASQLIAISSYTAEQIKNFFPKKSIEIINPGINIDKFWQAHEVCQPPYILSVGALKPRKGYETALRAFAQVRKKYPQLNYVIVGDQRHRQYYEHLKSLTQELNIDLVVKFKDNISDEELRQLYRQAHLFLLLSENEGYHFEGFGLVFLEAAAAGTPTIGTLNNGISDTICDGATGFLIPQKNVIAAAKAIEHLMLDQQLWLQFSRASLDWVKKYDQKIAARLYEKIYTDVVAGRVSRSKKSGRT